MPIIAPLETSLAPAKFKPLRVLILAGRAKDAGSRTSRGGVRDLRGDVARGAH